jgi:hypothetical protein
MSDWAQLTVDDDELLAHVGEAEAAGVGTVFDDIGAR